MIKAIALGLLVGVLVALDPVATAYLLRDYDELRMVPYALSLAAAAALSGFFMLRAFAPNIVGTVIQEYPRYFAFLFLFAYQFTGVKAGPLDPTEVTIGVFLLLFIAGLFIRASEQRFLPTPFNALHLAIVGAMTLSLAVEFKVLGLLKGCKPLVVFFLLVNFLPRGDFLLSFLRWLVILAVLSALFGFVQEITFLTTGEVLSLVEEKTLKRMFEDTPLGPIFRIPGMMVSYRTLAVYMATALMLCLSSLLWRTEKPILPRGWAWFSIVVLISAIMLTISKDVMLGMTAAIGLLLILHKPRRVAPLALLGLAGVTSMLVLIAVIPGNIDTALQMADEIPKAEQERIRLDRDSMEGVLHSKYTWLGRGIGAGPRYTAHPLRWPAHNAFILVTAELGVVGLVLYLTLYGLVFARLIALNLLVRDGPYLPMVRGLLATLIIVLVGAQFEASYLDVYYWTIFATVEALWIRVRYQELVAPEAAALRY